ncbi:MAG: MFS transporter [Wenzhouxiangellaceae bacterium]|nr:MFS transporter [Wenzhouxiangellaceae bacterium]
MSPPDRIPTSSLILFGGVNLPLSMLLSPTAAILPNFYLEYTGVTVAGLATAMLVARLFDGLTDPIIGLLSDRSGRRKPWMLAGSLLIMLGAWFLYQPQSQSGTGFLLAWYLVVTLGWTLVEIPHTAMAAELSVDYDERTRIVFWRQLLGFVGGVLFMASPLLLIGGSGAFTPEVMRTIALFIIVAMPLAVLLMVRSVAEPKRRVAARRIRPADLWLAIQATPPLRYFLLTQILFGLATGAVSGLFVIYASQYLDLADRIPHIAMPMTLAMAAGMPLWLWIMRRYQKHRVWALGAVGMIATLLAVLAIPPGGLVAMIGAATLLGLFIGLSSIALPSLLADVVDYDLWKNQKDRAAIFFSFQALVTKLNQGVGGAGALAVAGWFGFSGKEALTEGGALGLKVAFVAWPCVLLVPMIVLAWHYPLDRRAHGILKRRLAGRVGRVTGPA